MSTQTTIEPSIPKSKVPKLSVVIDLGTSCIKSLYLKGRRGKLKYLVSSPVVCPTSSPQGDATYIKFPEDEVYYLVGDSAAQTKLQPSIRQLKSESIVFKTLGIIGQIAQEESLPEQFGLSLSLLLPISELNEQEFCRAELLKGFSSFNYSGNNYRIIDSKVEFKPEGSGVCSYILRTTDTSNIKSQVYVYLMFGYRNTSMLLVEKGKLNPRSSQSTDLGFYNYLDLIVRYSSGLYREDIQRAIVSEAIYQVEPNCQRTIAGFSSEIRIEDLVRGSNSNRERSKIMITDAIKRADAEYWQMLSSWLEEFLPPLGQVHQII
ncbi:MAG: hypothetical protein AAFN00_07315, partial [Cyanobacteria bacterium J06558_2]